MSEAIFWIAFFGVSISLLILAEYLRNRATKEDPPYLTWKKPLWTRPNSL